MTGAPSRILADMLPPPCIVCKAGMKPVFSRYGDGPVPGDYIMAHWTGPDRARVRDDCRRAVVEHRATGGGRRHPPGRAAPASGGLVVLVRSGPAAV